MIRFILNEITITTDLPAGTVLLDFIRYHQQLMGTKIGCREGDCGACTILLGELKKGELRYQSMVSCLLPLGNVHGKHIVTIEGINMPELNPVQQVMVDAGAMQCGFCTPGFVMSLAGFCLSDKEASNENAIAAINGNICRCTGYKSIERAAEQIAAMLKARKEADPVQFAAKEKILPAYFASIKTKLQDLHDGKSTPSVSVSSTIVGGGTDLYVQKHDEMTSADISFVFDDPAMKKIIEDDNKCILGPSVTVSDLAASPFINKIFPQFQRYTKLISSIPIRNMATLAGNFVNASPIGDFTIFFLALDAQLTLSNGKEQRTLPLRKLYKGYKQLNKAPDEYIKKIEFEVLGKNTLFNFEKVSKRTHLDIASVNSAMRITVRGQEIIDVGISAGGLAPVPVYLQKASEFLHGKFISEETVYEAIKIAKVEVSPIGDTRGTKEYKMLLLGQLIKAHFILLFPQLKIEKFA
ncbi:xanthine dehydrogenase small subunit [soil metagenome]